MERRTPANAARSAGDIDAGSNPVGGRRVDQARIDEVNEELNYPSLQKLKRVLDSRGIPYDRKDLEKLVSGEAVRQVQAPRYKFDGKIAAHGMHDRWFCDLIDFTAAPSDRGKRTGLGEAEDGEIYILVVQDVFSRFLWTEALTSKSPTVVAEAFERIMARAGAQPKSVTSDLGSEFQGPFKRLLEAKGVEVYTKRKEDINAIATIDTAIGNLKKALVRDARKVGTDDWASRLEKVTKGQNNNPIDEYLEGMPPSNVSTNPDLIDVLKQKNASYSEFNQKRVAKRAQRLEETGQFRIMEDMGGAFTRGFKPRFGEVRQVNEIQGATVLDNKNQDHLTKFVLPITSTDNDLGPRRIEQRGSQTQDAARRARLQPFADELVRFLQRKGSAVTTATASKHLREQPGFEAAMRNVRTFGAFVNLFDSLRLITTGDGGTSKVRLANEATRRRLRGKQQDPDRRV
tara:strand:+ start:73 stop:1449 length:1377 start_codon:yes stop_codon:yes gene_type:complete